tara:strand:+ start:621 stop:893 length:273 start_codon:yes stop_codon:yes gene_type:complete
MIKRILKLLSGKSKSEQLESLSSSISDINEKLEKLEKDIEKHSALITQIATIQAELINQAKYIFDSVNSQDIDSIFINALYSQYDDDTIN